MKIGFIYVKGAEDDAPVIELVFGYLKAYLARYLDHPIDFVRFSMGDLFSYDVVAVSTLSQDFNTTKNIVKLIKNKCPTMPIVIGGQHTTWLPNTIIPEMDFAVLGEGEQTFLELVHYFVGGRKDEDLFIIPGLAFWRDGGLMFTPPRPLIENMDNIPHPFRESRTTNRHIFTSRGCPFKCSFCSSTAFWKKVRFHSADYVVDEIASLLSIGTTNIPVMDDLFVANKKRFAEIIKKLKKMGLDRHYRVTIQVTAHDVTDEFVEILRGFDPIDRVIFSSESGCDRILKTIGKGNTVAKNQEATDKLYNTGIKCGTSWIVGWPGETEEELRETCRWIMKNVRANKFPNNASFNILTPLPGTKVWDEAVASGLIDINTFDWDRLHIWAPQSNFPGWKEWINLRHKYNTIYLNEHVIPQDKLFQILEEEGALSF